MLTLSLNEVCGVMIFAGAVALAIDWMLHHGPPS